MTSSYAVQLQRLDSVPLAVIRRQASAAELGAWYRSAVAWSGTRCGRSGHRPVVTSLSIGMAAFGSRWGWSFLDRLPSTARSYARQHPLARWHRPRISGLMAASAPRTTPFAGGARPMITASQDRTGRSTVTGSASGMPIRREFAPTSTICCQMAPAFRPCGRTLSCFSQAVVSAFRRT
jgi:hypothetical protein